MLQELDYLPEGLLQTEAAELEALLGGPTLIHLRGRQEPALFISVLMHGNEISGWDAVRGLLGRYMGGNNDLLPRSVSLFIGNVAAAAQGVRRLDGQPDYNRVWPGSELPYTPEHGLIEQVVDAAVKRGLFASVDIHNNTGLNPHYACINAIDHRFLHMASMFSRTVVYFLRPRGVQSMAMAQYCPSVTLECGKVGHTYGSEHAMEYLDACLRLTEHPEHPVAEHDVDLFHTVATVKVHEETSFGFGEQGVDIQFADDLDQLNFRELPRGTSFGRIYADCGIGLEVRDEQGQDVTERYFALENDELRVRVPVMPSMLTRDHRVVRQDCLCYLMERYNDHLGG